ncbi:hypothetical protein [Enterococcus gallinarum]|uniref:hypothetical protein n=1 Tax=Enterococcus gallinarum TaxID=1353 RepID=UPI001F55CBE0|nr:hypothetical protein [Enterococcus gallinarum]
MNVSEVLKWLEDEADRLLEECDSNHDPYKSINNSFLEGFNYAVANVEALEQPQLNENQQIVLEFLKGIAVKTDSAPIVTFADFGWQHFGSALPSTVEQAYQSMNGKQDLMVMSAYVNWALEQEAE